MLTLAVLAGGKSSRMGRDKALLPLAGRPLILHVIERLSTLADEVLLSVNDPAEYAFLGFPIVADSHPGAGPLGGLYAALKTAKNPFVAAVACDMPFASRALFEYERDFIIKTEADAVLPATPAGLEPLHALYQRETCLGAIASALNAHQYKLVDWMAKVSTRLVPPEVVLQFDPRALAFRNLNTPEDFALAEEQARLEEE